MGIFSFIDDITIDDYDLGLKSRPVNTQSRIGKTVTRSSKPRNYFGWYRKTKTHETGMRWAREMYGLQAGTTGLAGRALGFYFLGKEAYRGYKENGLTGAVTGVARGFAESYVTGAVTSATWMPAVATIGAGLAYSSLAGVSQGASLSQTLARPLVHDYIRKRAMLEMGSPLQDQLGNMSTMRQRSISAMRQSKITARSALGMEGSRRYIPYLR